MTSLVNHETGEIVEVTYADVRDSVHLARESGAKFFEQIVWQIERQAWTVLGHSSWDEMREAEYADMGVVVPRADRPEVVARMRKSGLTQQQIADTLGVDRKTVRSDLNGATPHSPAEPIVNARGQERPASYIKTDDGAPPTDTDPLMTAVADDPDFPASEDFRLAAALAEFPDLTFYADRGRDDDALRLASALRAYDPSERVRRLNLLRATIAAEIRKESEPSTKPALDPVAAGNEIFLAANTACQRIAALGGVAALDAALAHAHPLEADTWREQFSALAALGESLAATTKPKLRSLK